MFINKKITACSFLIITIIIAACSPKLYTPLQSDVSWAQTKFSNVDLSKLQRGKHYYETKCGNCHGLKKPEKYSEADWQRIMPEMARKAKIADTTSDVIMTYVLTSAHAVKQQKAAAK